MPPRLPPGDRTGHPILHDGWQHDGEDHRRTLATVVAVGLEDGRGRAHDRVVFWVRYVQHRYLVPLCTRASCIIIGHNGVISPVPGVGVGPPVVRDRPSLHVRLVPQVQESGRQRVTPGRVPLLPAATCVVGVVLGAQLRPRLLEVPSVPVLLAETESLTLWILTR